MIKRSHSDRPQRPGPEGCVLRGHSARTRSTSARSQPQPPPAPPRPAHHARSRTWDAALYTHLSAPGARTHLSAQFARNTARTAQGAHTFSRHRATHSLVLAASRASRSHARRTSCHPELAQFQSTTTPTRTRRAISLHHSPCRRRSAAAAPWFRIVCTVADQPMRSLYRRTAADQLSPHAQLMCRHSALHLNRERQRVSRAALIRKCVRTPAHGIDVPEQPITLPNSPCTCTLGEARP